MADENTAQESGAEPSLGESLSAAYDAAVTGDTQADNTGDTQQGADKPNPSDQSASPDGQADKTQDAQAAAQRARDEQGRFTAQKEAARQPAQKPPVAAGNTANAQATQQQAQPQAQAPKVEPPKHWPVGDKERFSKLPPQDQQWLLGRTRSIEADYTRRVQALQPLNRVKQVLDGWQGYLTQLGHDPAAAINTLFRADALLRNGTPTEKMNYFRSLGEYYGIPLDKLSVKPEQQEYVDPHVQTLQQQYERIEQQQRALMQEQQQRQQRWEQERTQQALSVLENQVTAFADEKDANGNLLHPHFEEVADEMNYRIQIEAQAAKAAGQVWRPDLKSLYDKAVWSNQDLRQRIQKAEQDSALKRAQDQARARAAQSQRAAISTTGAPGTSASPKSGSVGHVRDDLLSAWESHA